MEFPEAARGLWTIPTPALSVSLVSSLATSLTCANTEVDVIKQKSVLQTVASATSGVQSGYSHKNCFWRDRHGYASGWAEETNQMTSPPS